MELSTLDFIEGLVNRIGLSLTISIFSIWIVTDIYLTIKKKIVKHLELQTINGSAIAQTASDQLKILEVMQMDQRVHCAEAHDFMLEARIKLLGDEPTEGGK